MDSAEGSYSEQELSIPQEKTQKLETIVSERNRIMELIQKAEAGKDRVKPEIYAKVVSDYEAKLAEVAAQYEPVRAEIAQGLAEIRVREQDLRARRDAIHDELEELRFRCDVGEFTPDELAAKEAERKAHTDELDNKLKIVETTYETCKTYLGEDDFQDAIAGAESPPPAAPDEGESPPPPPSAPEEEIISISNEPPTAPPPPPEGDVEVFSPPEGADLTLDIMPGQDVDISPAPPQEDVVIASPEEAPAPPPPPPPAAEPAPAYNPMTDGNPEMTLAEPIPFTSGGDQSDSTLDGGPIPGAPAGSDVEATISFQKRSLINLFKDDGTQDTFLLGMEPLTIGRNHKNDVVLLDRSISRKHAEVKKEDGEYVIQDMSSGGGMTVNGERSKRTVLKDGDEIMIGEFKLMYRQEMGY